MALESGGKRLDVGRLPDPDPIPGTISWSRHDPFRRFDSVPAYMESFSAIFRICTPCTRDAPPRIAAAT